MRLHQYLFSPFSFIYLLVTGFRNLMYNRGWKKSHRFDIPVISVGNLIVGGAGKTPMVEYLVRKVSNKCNVVVLSRGYGRKTKGYRLANNQDTSLTIGDEPYQIYNKFGDKIAVAVGEKRVPAIYQLIAKLPELDVVILDDAFQHRAVQPSISILLTEFSKPFYQDHVLPSGLLREKRDGAKRADIIVVTKCPKDLGKDKRSEIKSEIYKYVNPGINVFFTTINYDIPRHFYSQKVAPLDKCVVVTGIARANKFIEYAKGNFEVLWHEKFSDHHDFKVSELKNIKSKVKTLGPDVMILTTEKDYVRIKNKDVFENDYPIFYIPITQEFLNDGTKFDNIVDRSLEAKSKA